MEHPLILISIGELATFIVELGNSSGVCIKVTSSVAAVASASKTSIGTKSNVSVSLLLISTPFGTINQKIKLYEIGMQA